MRHLTRLSQTSYFNSCLKVLTCLPTQHSLHFFLTLLIGPGQQDSGRNTKTTLFSPVILGIENFSWNRKMMPQNFDFPQPVKIYRPLKRWLYNLEDSSETWHPTTPAPLVFLCSFSCPQYTTVFEWLAKEDGEGRLRKIRLRYWQKIKERRPKSASPSCKMISLYELLPLWDTGEKSLLLLWYMENSDSESDFWCICISW